MGFLENFEFFVIEFVTEKELLIKVEQKYLDMVPSNLRYNFCPTAGSRLGTTHSPSTKAAIRESMEGNTNRVGSTHSPETPEGAAISNARKGMTHSDATKAVMSEAHKGKVFSDEHKAAISKAHGGGITYVYDINDELLGSFPSRRAAAKFLGVTHPAVSKLVDTGRRNIKGS